MATLPSLAEPSSAAAAAATTTTAAATATTAATAAAQQPPQVSRMPSDTLHSVASTAKRRQKRKGGHLRARSTADVALAAAVDEQLAKRAREAPPSDEPRDDTEMT